MRMRRVSGVSGIRGLTRKGRELFVVGDLGEAEGAGVEIAAAGVAFLVPADGFRDGGVDAVERFPANEVGGFGDVELEEVGFVRLGRVAVVGGVPSSCAPGGDDALDNFFHGHVAEGSGAEVEGVGEFGPPFKLAGGEGEVAGEGFEDVLPGADGGRVADDDRFAFFEGADGVGEDAVEGSNT